MSRKRNGFRVRVETDSDTNRRRNLSKYDFIHAVTPSKTSHEDFSDVHAILRPWRDPILLDTSSIPVVSDPKRTVTSLFFVHPRDGSFGTRSSNFPLSNGSMASREGGTSIPSRGSRIDHPGNANVPTIRRPFRIERRSERARKDGRKVRVFRCRSLRSSCVRKEGESYVSEGCNDPFSRSRSTSEVEDGGAFSRSDRDHPTWNVPCVSCRFESCEPSNSSRSIRGSSRKDRVLSSLSRFGKKAIARSGLVDRSRAVLRRLDQFSIASRMR